jgi:EAL domain-containing protein (putative c-di-GMP-specific phosphodiesterase class I)
MFHLSPRQLWQRDLADRLLERLDASGVDPHSVIVELTESAAMTDPERTRHVLVSLARRGVRIAIDDFGMGYSSLSRLKDLPVDVVKIDRSFVHDLSNHRSGTTLVKAIIRLARSLSMTPLAKGIDDEQESAFLWEQGCHLGQGPYFGRPVTGDEVPGLYQRGLVRLPATA